MAADALTFGTHPFLREADVHARFAPLVRYLAKEIGRPVDIRVASSYRDHIQKVGLDKIDFAYMGPLPYVRMVEAHGLKPLLAAVEVQGAPRYRGIIFTYRDSGITSLADLEGRRLAFGDPDSTMSYLVPRGLLRRAGITLEDLSLYEFVGNHANVALNVLARLHDAGAVREDIFERYRTRGLVALSRSGPQPTHVLVARRGLPSETIDQLRRALLRLKDPRILSSLFPGATGFVEAQDDSFDDLRRLRREIEGESRP